MSGPIPYLLFPGNAAEALEHYRSVFGVSFSSSTTPVPDDTTGREMRSHTASSRGRSGSRVRMPEPTTTRCR